MTEKIRRMAYECLKKRKNEEYYKKHAGEDGFEQGFEQGFLQGFEQGFLMNEKKYEALFVKMKSDGMLTEEQVQYIKMFNEKYFSEE